MPTMQGRAVPRVVNHIRRLIASPFGNSTTLWLTMAMSSVSAAVLVRELRPVRTGTPSTVKN